jgi:(2R)-ethylmalonyl-CoA mutase
LFRRNLAKGQTGLSVAFDLPTQTGYDPDHELARGEVGRVGVPIAHLGDARALFAGLDFGAANTSMTINATAMWLLALYATVASRSRVALESTGWYDPERHRQGTCPRDLHLPARALAAVDRGHDRLDRR